MLLLDRYIRNSVLLAMAVVILLMAAIDLAFSLTDELGDTEAGYGTMEAFRFILQTTPTHVYELLPFTALGGALIGLGLLASNNELVVMQSAGISTWRIVLAVLKPTFLVMVLSLVLGEFVSPPLEEQARSTKAQLLSANATIGEDSGSWQRIGNEFIHINAIAPGGRELFGVSRFRINSRRQLDSASFAESANYIEGTDRNYWQLNGISETLFTPDGTRVQEYLQLDWFVDLTPELLSVLLVEPDNQSITGLWRLARYFESESLDADSFYLAFWKKLFQPLATLSLVFLGISFVFGPLREVTTGQRVFAALAVGLVFMILQRLVEPTSLLYGSSPVLVVLLPIAIFAGLGAYLMRRIR